MGQIRTHYDNLKVARNAPPEIIRAAYKTLSQKFHPDRNPGNPEAARIMVIINSAYEVLSDPGKRREHDLWIEQQEKEATEIKQSHQTPQQPLSEENSRGIIVQFIKFFDLYTGIVPFIKASVFLAIIFYLIGIWGSSLPSSDSKPYQTNSPPKPYQAPVQPTYVRPTTAPNGNPWPTSADYIKGYPRLNAKGLSTVTVDNSLNDSDVFVKLISLDSAQAYPVRQFYIPAFGSFTLNKITAGSYDIRYRDLSNGDLSRSEAFNLVEISTHNGKQYSNITMTLYKVQNGNMQTYHLSETEF